MRVTVLVLVGKAAAVVAELERLARLERAQGRPN